MKALREKVEMRLTGADEKAEICRVQLISAYVFLPAGLILALKASPALALLFVSEAIGQFLMAKDNQRTLSEGDVRFRYLPATTFGKAATVVFSITAFSRFWLASQYQGAEWMLALGGVLSLAMVLGGMFSNRPEEAGGVVLTVSAFFLAAISFLNHDLIMTGSQFLYGTLLVTGVLVMRASRAEVINIVLWLTLFFGFLASPQT